MKRRGFLGLMGGAAVAGPGMVKQAAAGVESMAVGGVLPGLGAQMPDGPYGVSTESQMATEYNHGDWLRGQIKNLAGVSVQERRTRINERFVSVLDPDLAVNRSFSLSAKVAMQRERDYERSIAREKRHLMNDLADWLKRQG